MTREDKHKVEFYSGNAVQSVLEKYTLSSEEKKVIYAAIRTAKKETPSMKLIDTADQLLKEIASSRTANTAINAKSNKLGSDEHAWVYKGSFLPRGGFRLRTILLAMVVVGICIIVIYKLNYGESSLADTQNRRMSMYSNFYTFSEAQKLCKSKGLTLPHNINDSPQFLDIPAKQIEEGFWRKDGKVAYDALRGIFPDDKNLKKCHVVCVSK